MPPSLPHEDTAADVAAMAQPACRGVVDVSGQNGIISSGPPVPLTWNQGADCRWVIEAPGGVDTIRLDFEAFRLHGVHGHLRIYAGHQNVAEFRGSAEQDSLKAVKTFTELAPPQHDVTVSSRIILLAWRAEPCDLTAHFLVKWSTECTDAPCTMSHPLMPGMEKDPKDPSLKSLQQQKLRLLGKNRGSIKGILKKAQSQQPRRAVTPKGIMKTNVALQRLEAKQRQVFHALQKLEMH